MIGSVGSSAKKTKSAARQNLMSPKCPVKRVEHQPKVAGDVFATRGARQKT